MADSASPYCVTKLCNDIEISVSDDRQYLHITLDNALEVLLISDPEAEKASAAMDVHVGHQSDPDELPGLAHFCEHMLFLGTTKYPDENSYKQFLSEHNGHSNACTSGTHTRFYFDIASEHLYFALDRFAAFFTNPLFTPSAVMREMQAVHSEHCKNLQNDHRRLYQLQKELANPAHPFHKFGTGNLETLLERPKKLYGSAFDIRESLLSFYERHYCASIMRLVIYGTEDLKTLKTWAQTLFSGIRNIGREIENASGIVSISPFEESSLPLMLIVEPVRELRSIELSWPLPSLYKKTRSKPSRIIAHLLGHEGRHSILSLLKAKQWANALYTQLSHDEVDWAQFSLKISATEEGLQCYKEVVALVYEYLAMLCANLPLPSWIFQETQNLAEQDFCFKHKEEAVDYTSFLSETMHRYTRDMIVSGCYLIKEYNAEEVEDILSRMTPQRMQLIIVSKSFFQAHAKPEAIQYEPYYQTPYVARTPSAELIEQWSRIASTHTTHASPQVRLALPHPNEFICRDFRIFVRSIPAEQAPNLPSLLKNDAMGRLYYKADHVFQKPRVRIMVRLYSPLLNLSPHHAVLSRLFVRYLMEELNEYAYDAELAGMEYSLSATPQALELYVTGYQEKATVLLDKVMLQLTVMTNPFKAYTFDKAIFDRVHDCCARQYRNFWLEEPYQHAVYASQLLTRFSPWSIESKLEALTFITLPHLVQHAHQLFTYAPLFLEAFIYGNISSATALATYECSILDKLQTRIHDGVCRSVQLSTYPQARQPRASSPRITLLQAGNEYTYSCKNLNADNVSSALCNLYQLPPLADPIAALEQQARLHLLAHLLHEPCFNQLRTKEQLGYLVFSGRAQHQSIMHLRILLQSEKAAPDYLDQRVTVFLLNFRDHMLLEMHNDSETWKKYVSAVVHSLLERPKHEKKEASRIWHEIVEQKYVFDRRQQLARCISSLQPRDMLLFFDKYFSPLAEGQSKLSVRVYGKDACLEKLRAGHSAAHARPVATCLALMQVLFGKKRRSVAIENILQFSCEMPLAGDTLPSAAC